MTQKILIACLILFGLLVSLGLGWLISDRNTHPKDAIKPFAITNDEIVLLVNVYRHDHNLPTLSKSDDLCRIAQARLPQIQTDWSHDGFWPYVKTLTPGWFYGENLARELSSSQSVVDNWAKSPEHKANLDNTHYTETCVATDGNYIVMEYGGK